MTQLARARLVEFISPDEHLGRYDEPFCANFLALVQTHALMEVPEPRRSTRLHAEKMSWALFEQLRRLRDHLDGRLADLAMIEHPALRQVKADAVLDEIRSGCPHLPGAEIQQASTAGICGARRETVGLN